MVYLNFKNPRLCLNREKLKTINKNKNMQIMTKNFNKSSRL